ncbi:glycoside hydrolase family 2 TIM barrel-domain containing protein [Pseudochryseolinea flava]|uniref:Glycoside hydrolase family 2 n=1 Tax=Pseudochryseolinea flava TaxID=2059302 RepID=A0A364Y1Y8_9BACT|nr:glycoside hydrolase family 2 TIM barrel-domain containing protein [Pseudochryseolinea flava]RAW00885.1 glycoside hydrolase family 2 [Pseudochryseolinea flava]
MNLKRKTLYILIAIGALVTRHEVNGQMHSRLNSGWEFLRSDLGGIWESVRPVGKGNPESVPLWTKVNLPHCYNAMDAVDPDVNYYQGPAWYRTQIKIDNPYRDGRTILHFEGAGQKTSVYVYTTKVAEHVGGYDEWTADITDAVAAFKKLEVYEKQFKGEVPISIRTDNSRDLEMIPSSLSDFNVYGGIYRYLNLVYKPAVAAESIFITPSVEGKIGRIKVEGIIHHSSTINKAQVTITVLDPGGKKVLDKIQTLSNLKNDRIHLGDFTIKSPMLWSTDKPLRYTLQIVLNVDDIKSEVAQTFGFRSFEFVEQGPFKLNGQRLLLRGTHRHEDHALTAAAMTDAMMRQEMIMMKEMGVNFIRLGHYQQSRTILDLCDSLGILVWEEIPWCRGGLGGEIYQEQAKRMLTNMIEQHYNHPSIIIWGLGNENDWPGDFSVFDKEAIRAFMKILNDLSHTLDPTRKTAIRRCDFCKDIVDVYSPSIWAGWYRGIYTEYKESSLAEYKKVKHFLHVEWGGDSHAGRHSESPDRALNKIVTGKGTDERSGDASLFGGSARVSKDGDWSESYICNLIDWHLKEQETMPWLTGTAYWPFKDFSTPVRPDNPVPYVNQKGVVQRDFEKKESYYVFQSYWATKPMVHIYGHSWPVRWGDENEEKMMKVYSNCDEVELWLNGKSLGKKKRSSQDFPAAGLRWSSVFVKGKNTLLVVGRKGKDIVRDELSFMYQTEQWQQPAKLSMKIVERNENLATVEVTVLDKNNIQCLDASNWIRFSLAGDGTLIDNLGTSDGARLVQAYNGRATISVKLKNKSAVGAFSEGLATALLSIE